jgi:hypothetical protein
MDHRDHVGLLRAGVPDRAGTWADIGAGEGAFTLALADLLGPDGRIFAVDRDTGAAAQRAEAPPPGFDVPLHDARGGLHRPRPASPDGLVAAFFPGTSSPADRSSHPSARRAPATGGRLPIWYRSDVDRVPWVPHRSRPELGRLASGRLVDTEQIAGSSRFLGAIYSAVSWRPRAADRA